MLKVTNGRCFSIRLEDEVLTVLIDSVDNEGVGRALSIASVLVFANDYSAPTFKGKFRIA